MTIFSAKRGFAIRQSGTKTVRVSANECRAKLIAVLESRYGDWQFPFEMGIKLTKDDYRELNWAVRELLFDRLCSKGLDNEALLVAGKAQFGAAVPDKVIRKAVDVFLVKLRKNPIQRPTEVLGGQFGNRAHLHALRSLRRCQRRLSRASWRMVSEHGFLVHPDPGPQKEAV